VLTLHRFTDPELGNAGFAVKDLRALLEWVRREGRPVLRLSDVVTARESGAPVPHGGLIFTVDDGYADFATQAAEVFAEFDCPVTVFVVTGFLDRALWLWWDQLLYLMRRLPVSEIRLDSLWPGQQIPVGVASERGRNSLALSLQLEHVSTPHVHQALRQVATEYHIDLPAEAPPEFRAMSWDDAARLARRGVDFGPHTVTHPILAQCDDVQVRHEIQGAWRVLQSRLPEAVPVFCIPSGGPRTFGRRELAAFEAAGLSAAVTTQPAYVSMSTTGWEQHRFSIPRFPCPESQRQFVEIASGAERFKGLLRPLWSGRPGDP
jgi:peptidoglycan/xylan/chitin deacetylase (PgdA/CDA1 family)